MRDIKWTDRQESAISEKNTNLLVSAAAGSGKTAVLVERIIRLILEGGTDIDRFLVVTFTKAAAAEMKEKLVRAVRAQIRVETDPEKRAFLHRQLDRMYLANISTFHSFAIGVVRRFFQYADVDPTVRVIDEGEADILFWDAMEDVFRALFDENDPAFVRFLDRHSRNGGEESLRQALLKDYNRLRSIPHYLEWLEDNLTRLTKPVPAALQGEALAYLRSVYLDALNKARGTFGDLYELLRENGVETFAVQIGAQLDAVDEMIRICTE
ncbi:MAG: UvrD-helicase domain-containing protein, partial [Clostridiales bacterium]|nr:UvrD-helicase domain-containing protein [Clostridiales bacterium]